MTRVDYDFASHRIASHRIASHRIAEDNCALFASCEALETEYNIRDG
jgi:hypothetical protein